VARRRPKHWSAGTRRGGPEVNENLEPAIFPPGPWVDDVECVCMDHPGTYKNFNSRVTFGEAADRVRQVNRDNPNAPGGWRSRGAVLWAMRVIKLERWYDAHAGCGFEIPEDPEEWGDLTWAYYDESVDAGFEGTPEDFARRDDPPVMESAARELVDPFNDDDEEYWL
jgi:hypothetical protein